MLKILEVIFIQRILFPFLTIIKQIEICHPKCAILGKLINTSKMLQIYKIVIDLMNNKNNCFLLKSLALINSISPFSFPNYLVECL